MLDYQANPRRYQNFAIAYLMLGLAAILLYSVFFTPRFLGDELFWNKLARAWRGGEPLFSGVHDNKLPGIVYIHLLSNLLFKPNPYFARLLAVALQLGGALAVYRMAWKFCAPLERLWCLAAYVVVISAPNTDIGNGGTTEAFLHPLCALAFLIYTYRPDKGSGLRISFWSGLAMGAAICFKQSAALSLLALMCWPLLERGLKGWKESFIMLCAASIFNALMLAPALATGTTVQQIYSAIHPQKYFMNGPENFFYINWYVWQEWIPPIVLIFFVLWRRREAWPFLLWLAADCVAANTTGEYFSHQFKQLVPSFAVCAGLMMAAVFRKKTQKEQYSEIILLSTMFFIFYSVLAAYKLNI